MSLGVTPFDCAGMADLVAAVEACLIHDLMSRKVNSAAVDSATGSNTTHRCCGQLALIGFNQGGKRSFRISEV